MSRIENWKYILLAFKYSKKILEWLCKKEIISEQQGLYKIIDSNQRNIPHKPSHFDPGIALNSNKPIILPSGYSKCGLMHNTDVVCIHIRPALFDKKFSYDKIYEMLSLNGIPIFMDAGRNAFCRVSEIPHLLRNFSDTIGWLELPEGYRIPKDCRQYYFDILEYQIMEILAQAENPRIGSIKTEFVFSYEGSVRFGPGHNPEKFIDLRGIFAYKPIYSEIEWDFDLVESGKYKLNWKTLIEKSDLEWTEDIIEKYYTHIPFTSGDNKFYCSKFNYDSFTSYNRLGKLSSSFLHKHKEDIEWDDLFKTAKLDLTPSELEYFYMYAKSIEMPFQNCFSQTKAGEQIFISSLFENPYIKWTDELLKKALELETYDVMCICVKEERFNKMLRHIPGYEGIINKHVSKLLKECENEINKEEKDWLLIGYIKNKIEFYEDFWLRFNNGGKIPNRAYNEYFTVENIKRFHDEWEIILEEKFSGMNRTPDVNYHIYIAFNMWDCFNNNRFVTLTYEHCVLLKNMKIKLGGYYILDNGCYLSKDHRNLESNALDVFANHDFSTVDEIEKVILNDDLLRYFMESPTVTNDSIIENIFKNATKKMKLEEFITSINGLKQ